MSIEAAFTRIAELQSLLGGVTAPTAPAPATSTTTTAAPSSDQFAQMLRTASLPGATTPPATTTATGAAGTAGAVAPAAVPNGNSAAARMVALAQGEVGQAESPPGSN